LRGKSPRCWCWREYTSSTCTFTLKGLLETMAKDVTGYTDTQMSALQTMCGKYEDAMKDWSIDSIRNWVAQEK